MFENILNYFLPILNVLSNANEIVKEEEIQNEPDKDVWMKEYSLSKPRNEKSVNYSNVNSRRSRKSFDENSSELNSSLRSKFSDINNIYKGMSYEEWIRIRDNFLKSHDMV